MDKSKRMYGVVELTGMKAVLTLQWQNVELLDLTFELKRVALDVSSEWGEGILSIGPYVAPGDLTQDKSNVKTAWTGRIEIVAGLSTLGMAREILEKAAIFHTY